MSFSLLEHIKIDVGWGFASDLTGGAYSAPQPLAGFKGATSRQEGNGGEGKKGLGEGKRGREEKGVKGDGRKKGEVGE